MRIFATLIAYNRPHTVRGALENFEWMTSDLEHRRIIKTILDPGYPLPCPDQNSMELKKLAVEFGWWHTKIPNLGVVPNHNTAIHDLYRMQRGDYYLIHDPDVRIQEKEYVSAAIEVLNSMDDIVFVCPSREFSHEQWCIDRHGATHYHLGSGLRVRAYKNLCAWSCGIFKGEFLASRPRDFNSANPAYGYAEHSDYDRMNAMGKTWRQLVDFHDFHLGAPDQLYTDWKMECAQMKTKLRFEEWLRQKGLIP